MNDAKRKLVNTIAGKVREALQGAEGGHDWQHIERVRRNANKISRAEGADEFIVELASLLHDIADAKFHDGDESLNLRSASQIMKSSGVPETESRQILNIIENLSFRSEIGGKKYNSLELNVVQDADRLDAIGAIGIARAFNYGGHKGREIYNPDTPPVKFSSAEEYKSNTGPTINHFYEKLLLLKDMMKTEEGKRLASQRHDFMLTYLKQFYEEVNPD